MNKLRHVIVEGCEGSGKDTLLASLLDLYPNHTLHERSSTSTGGPIDNLGAWVSLTTSQLSHTGPWFFNRHPIISELLHRPFRRITKPSDPIFNDVAWFQSQRQAIAEQCMVVVCQPPFLVLNDVLERQGASAHMPGTFDNRANIYREYASLTWPGVLVRYDYTTHNALPELCKKINNVLSNGRP